MRKTFKLAMVALIATFILSCSSPEKNAQKLGEKYCDCIENYSTFTEPKEFRALMDSCQTLIKDEWAQYEEKYKQDEKEWESFVAAYNSTLEKSMGSFNEALSKIIAEIEMKIKEQLKGTWWLKAEETKGYYLYSFSENKLQISNCSGETEYELKADTLKFKDADTTMVLVSFPSEGTMMLTDCKTAKTGNYQIAAEKDKLLGSWSVKGGLSVVFYQGGSCTVTQGWSKSNAKYTFQNNYLEIDGPPAYQVNLSNMNYFSWGNAQFSRNKYAHPKDLNILF